MMYEYRRVMEMPICSKCKKVYGPKSNFCSNCGIPLVEMPDTGLAAGDTNHTIGTASSSGMSSTGGQTCDTAGPVYPPPSNNTAIAAVPAEKTNTGAIAGMLIVNFIPILGFPASFLWAWAKFKTSKAKVVAFSAVFLIINIAATLFGYAATIALMKNSLERAAEKQVTAAAGSQNNGKNQSLPSAGNNPASGQYSAQNGIAGINTNPMQDIPGIDPGILTQLLPGFSGSPGETGNIGQENYQLPEGVTMPQTDEEGNMHIDTDGDGKYDGYFDDKWNFIPNDAKTDASGNKFIDYDGDGTYETLIDSEGALHYDLDGDGKYESEQEWSDGGS